MSLALTRKRSRLDLEGDEQQLVPASPTFSDTLKRTKTQSELDDLDIIAPEEAWNIDVSSILSSPTLTNTHDGTLQAHNSLSNCDIGSSITVFCVQGNLQLHYDLLWYHIFPLCAYIA